MGLELEAEVLAEEAQNTAAIEGEHLDRDSIRSSVARRLGLPTAGLPPVHRQVDGLIEMLLEVHTDVTMGPGRRPLGHFVERLAAHGLAVDPDFASHFVQFGGGRRIGWAWFDLSAGREEGNTWSGAFRIVETGAAPRPELETEPLTAAQIEKLRAILERA